MRTITKEMVSEALGAMLPKLAFDLPADIENGLCEAARREESPRASEVLRLLTENARVAHEDRVAICQDTGSVWVCLEAGPDVAIAGDALAGVNDAVSKSYL